jgi:hypothetical protein
VVAAIVFRVLLPSLRGEARELIVAQGLGADSATVCIHVPVREMSWPEKKS